MRGIEAELHQMLLDIAPGYSDEEQAIIVAEASSIFARQERTASKRVAVQRESRMMDAVLAALKQMQDWEEESDTTYIDGRGRSADQIVRSAGKFKRGTPDLGLDILNDDDMDVFFFEPDSREATAINLGDGILNDLDEEVHPDSLYRVEGIGRTRADSQSH